SPEGIAALQAAKPLAEKKREAMAKAVSVSERAKIDLSAEYRHPMPFTDCADVPDNAYPDGDIADKAIAHLQVLKDKPFFFAVGFLKPHLPFAAPKKYWDMYTRSQCAPSAVKDWPKGMPPIAGSNWGELLGYANGAKANEPDVARQLIHGYCAATSYVDAQIGRVIDGLDRLGLRGNTVIILWGDHGWKLGEYGAWCKHTNFELDAHAPLILDAPGCTQGRRTQALVEFVDIYPTLADLCGLPVPAACEGTSMVPLLNDPKRAWKAAAFSQYPRKGDQVMGYTMRTKDWRYTEWIDRKTRQVVARELYDHRLPGMELVNLADDPTHAGTVTKLSAQLAGGSGWKAVAKGVN
ncbi:sulfatase, partial [bacterium]|nr:sulfatase [bacterium]